jgi:hypothetical protein
VAVKLSDSFSSIDIPQTNRVIVAARDHAPIVGRKGNAIDAVGVTRKSNES